MLDRELALAQPMDGDHVETVSVVRSSETKAPYRSYLGQNSSLPSINGLEAAPAGYGTARLHFNKRHEVATSCHHIEIMAPEAEAVRLNGPPPRRQIGECGLLPPNAEALTRIFPLFDRHDVTASGHPQRVNGENGTLRPVSREEEPISRRPSTGTRRATIWVMLIISRSVGALLRPSRCHEHLSRVVT
jgi:hypothetical protein